MKKNNRPIFYIIGSLVAPAFGIAILPFLWTKITPHDYGLLVIVELVMAFGAAFIGLQQDSSLNRLYFEWEENTRKINTSTVITLNLVSLIIFGSALALIFNALFTTIAPESISNQKETMLIFLVYLILTKQRSIINAYLRVTGKSVVFLKFNTIATAIQASLIGLYVFHLDYGLYGYTKALLYSEILISTTSLLMIYSTIGISFNLSAAKRSINFSAPLMPAAVFSSSSMVVERLILLTFLPLASVGIYSICQKICSVVQLGNNSLKMIFAPKAFQMVENKAAKEELSHFRNKYFLLILLLCSVLLPAMHILTQSPGTENYKTAIPYFPVFVLISLITAAQPYFCSGPFFSKRTKFSSYSAFFDLLIFVVLGIPLSNAFELNGILAAKLTSTILTFSYSYYLSQFTYAIPLIISRKITFSFLVFFVLFFGIYYVRP